MGSPSDSTEEEFLRLVNGGSPACPPLPGVGRIDEEEEEDEEADMEITESLSPSRSSSPNPDNTRPCGPLLTSFASGPLSHK